MKKSIKRFLSNVFGIIRLPEMTILPGQLAFFFVLSVVPIITLIGYGGALLNVSTDYIKDFITQAFSVDVANLIIPHPDGMTLGFKFITSLIVGYLIASNGADSIIVASNSIYGIKNGSFIKRRIKALVMTFLIVLLFLFIIIVPIFGAKIVNVIKTVDLNSSVTRNIELFFGVLRGPLSWFIMFMFIKIIYAMAPDRRFSSANVNYGAIFTTILWTISTAIYSRYITKFANYDVVYGGLANFVILMLWVYLLATIFVIGMSLNYKEEELAKIGVDKID